MKRLACALAVVGSAGTLAGTAQDARAAKSPQGSSAKGALQLSILAPDSSSIGDQLSLDVVCKGAVVETIELYVDNALVAKRSVTTTQSRNILSFKLDTMLMSAGDHDVVVKAYGVDGKSSSGSARIRIPALDLNAPVRISYPQNGTQVNGVVPVRLDLDAEIARMRPYVSFFVDKEFKVLRNTPPYEFNWDTTKYSNGWHIVEAWSQDQDASSPTRARAVHVNVNNGGGLTSKQDKVTDLRTGEKPVEITIPSPTSTLDARNPDRLSSAPKGGALHTGVASPVDAARTNEPSAYGRGSVSAPAPSADRLSGPGNANRVKVQAKQDGGLASRPATRMAQNSTGQSSLPGPVDEATFPVIKSVSAPGSAGTLLVKPGETLPSVSRRTGVPAAEIANLNKLQGSGPIKRKSIVVPQSGSFEVAFNGTHLAFDVQPRVESGVKLAPFRQIFEHTGGKLYWFGGVAQTVRAVNESREIELKIGDKSAKVNNQAVKLEKSPYIESGRTIVPLTFIRDSMDVKVSYDEKSGRLLIESKK